MKPTKCKKRQAMIALKIHNWNNIYEIKATAIFSKYRNFPFQRLRFPLIFKKKIVFIDDLSSQTRAKRKCKMDIQSRVEWIGRQWKRQTFTAFPWSKRGSHVIKMWNFPEKICIGEGIETQHAIPEIIGVKGDIASRARGFALRRLSLHCSWVRSFEADRRTVWKTEFQVFKCFDPLMFWLVFCTLFRIYCRSLPSSKFLINFNENKFHFYQ